MEPVFAMISSSTSPTNAFPVISMAPVKNANSWVNVKSAILSKIIFKPPSMELVSAKISILNKMENAYSVMFKAA